MKTNARLENVIGIIESVNAFERDRNEWTEKTKTNKTNNKSTTDFSIGGTQFERLI